MLRDDVHAAHEASLRAGCELSEASSAPIRQRGGETREAHPTAAGGLSGN